MPDKWAYLGLRVRPSTAGGSWVASPPSTCPLSVACCLDGQLAAMATKGGERGGGVNKGLERVDASSASSWALLSESVALREAPLLLGGPCICPEGQLLLLKGLPPEGLAPEKPTEETLSDSPTMSQSRWTPETLRLRRDCTRWARRACGERAGAHARAAELVRSGGNA